MLDALRANPCRFIEALLDRRQLLRTWRAWRQRGTQAIYDEITLARAVATTTPPSGLIPRATDEQKAVLVIDARVPIYDRDSGSRSSFLYLQILRDLGYRVYFLPNDQLRREPYACELERNGVELLIGPGFRCNHWKHWLRRHAHHISHVILHRPNIAKRFLPGIQEIGGMKLLYFACDLRSLRDARHYQVNRDTFYRREADYWEVIERAIIAQVDRAYFFSAEETRIASTWTGGTKARTVPLFPQAVVASQGPNYSQRSGILFVGGFAHQPNVDAVLWFARNVFPLVRRALPNLHWHVVGPQPSAEIRQLAGNGIVIEGPVTEIRLTALYDQARIVVAPLRFGAGIKGKVVEAITHGIPVVTTSVGAEGIPGAETFLCISDTAQDQAELIIELYGDQQSWERVSRQVTTAAVTLMSRDCALTTLAEGLALTPTPDDPPQMP